MHVQAILAGQIEGSLNSASQLADRICKVTPLPTTARISSLTPDSTAGLLEHMEDLSRQVASLWHHGPTTTRSPEATTTRTPEITAAATPTTHGHLATPAGTTDILGTPTEIAHHVLPPAGKLHQQALTAANICTISSGHLFITDRHSKQRYVVDTGSDLCVFPRKLLPGLRERTDYTLYAANGTTIPTYRWTLRTLNMGLRHDFTWRFVIADMQLPIIGLDLLSNYGLLVNCRNNRLLEGVALLSMPGLSAPP